jgi:VCBS repeat-containing protein
VTYSIKAGTGDAAKFTIDSATGQVKLSESPDFETKASYAFTVVATDAAGNASEKAVTLNVTNVNEAPVAVADTASATEAGGTANGTAGTNATGNVLTNDTDVDSGDTKVVQDIKAGSGTALTVGANTTSANGKVVAGSFGTLTIGADGTYSYVVDNTNSTVQALNSSSTALTDTFTYTVKDAAGLTSSATLTVSVNGANDAPVAVADTASATEKSGTANGTAGTDPTGNVLSNDTDVDNASSTLVVQDIKAGSGSVTTVSAGTTSSTGTTVTGSFGTLKIGADGSYSYVVDNANATVQALNTTSTALTDTFTYTVKDPGGLSSTATLTVSVNGANDAPVITATSTARSYTENAAAIVANNDLSLSDVDSTNLVGATVQITSGLTTGDVLAFTAANGITGSYDAVTGKLSLTGSATVAQYKAALQGVTYASTSDDPTATSATRTLTWQVDDGSAASNLSNTSTSTINVTAVNDAPVNTLPTTFTIDPNVATTLTGLSVSDADIGSGSMTVNLVVSSGTLAATAGNAAITGTSTNMTLTGTLAQINATLATVKYTRAAGSATLTMTTNDGSGTATATDVDTSTITVAAPTVSVTSAQSDAVPPTSDSFTTNTTVGWTTAPITTALWTFVDPIGASWGVATTNNGNWGSLGTSNSFVVLSGAGTSTNSATSVKTITLNGGGTFSGVSFRWSDGVAAKSVTVPMVVEFFSASNVSLGSSSFTLGSQNNSGNFSFSFTGQARYFTISMPANNPFALDDLAYSTTAGATPVSFPAVTNNGSTLDTTPIISGTISRALQAGETVDIFRANVKVGTATVASDGVSWTFTEPTPLAAALYSYTAKIVSGATVKATSAAFSLTIAATPLVLDLNGDGVQTTSISEGTHFDLLNNGTKQSVGWVSKQDGLLAIDLNHDGKINSGAELFGNHTLLADGSRARDGWQALGQYDSNHDGKIDVQDDAFSQLLIWQDANGNGVADEGELSTLAQRGITSIKLSTDAAHVAQNGNELHGFSSYTTEDGTVHEVVDAWLQTQSTSPAVLTLSNGENVQLSTALSTAAAPYGVVDMSSDVAANIVTLTLQDVLAAPVNGAQHQLTVMGDANDSVQINLPDWTDSGTTVTQAGHTYEVYTAANGAAAQLLIDQAMLNAHHVI